MFLGNVPQRPLATLYECCDIFVMPSVREPFGITALEAMALGKPVVISKSAGAAELGGGMFPVDFWDIDLMAGTVLNLLDDNGLRCAAGQAARQTALLQRWPDRARETMQIYAKVVGHG